jgi:predicted glycosyltransferase
MLKFYQKCLKIWFDILTPKQLLFFEPMIEKLRKNNQILCTSRNYREVVELAKVRNVKLVLVGKHGGSNKSGKLKASLERTLHLSQIVEKFAPDLTISFCSPEAARISFGAGIKHIAFSDSPHAEAVMRLSVPFVQKLLIPWIIPKKEFIKYGIAEKDIIHYRSIDAALIVKQKSKNYSKNDFHLKDKKTILVRVEESQAAYIKTRKNSNTNIINEIAKELSNCNIVVLGRYLPHINQLKKEFGNKIIVMDKVVDGKALLRFTNIFIGSGGTMTAEAALMGIPTISYDAVPNHIEKYLVRMGLVRRQKNPKIIIKLVKKILKSDNQNLRKKARRILNSMEDPISKLLTAIRTVQ